MEKLEECDNVNEFFQLDRMNNQSCYNRTRKSNGEWSTRPFTRDRSLQICSHAKLSGFQKFMINWDLSNTYFISLSSLKKHLIDLENEYTGDSLQEYQSGSPQPVTIETFNHLLHRISTLIDSYGDNPPILMKFRDGSYPYIDQGKDTSDDKTSSMFWNIMLETCLPNLSIPILTKEMDDSGFYTFTLSFTINKKYVSNEKTSSPKLKQPKRVIPVASTASVMTGTLNDLKFSKTMTKKLPTNERENLDDSISKLIDKSNGICGLCQFPLDNDASSLEIDHIEPESTSSHLFPDGNSTRISNLQIVHKRCNRSKKALPNKIAVPIIKFREWCERKSNPSFDDVLTQYNLGCKPVEVIWDNEIPKLNFGSQTIIGSQAFTDPASAIKYFFCEVPVDYILNDKEAQPRMIIEKHVRNLALDFNEEPVHEPSNCRLVHTSGNFYNLLQFDGQHKTTAQIILERDTVPMKIYAGATIDQINQLVINIQQKIKKKPLTTSDTLSKLSDVVSHRLSEYSEKPGTHRSEQGFIDSVPKNERTKWKNDFLSEIRGQILTDDGMCKLYPYYQPPISLIKDNVVDKHLIKGLMYNELLTTDIDDPKKYLRDEEKINITAFLNAIYEHVIKDNWSSTSTDVQKRMVKNFTYQTALRYIVKVALETLPHVLNLPPSNPLLRRLDEDQKKKLNLTVKVISEWELWKTSDEEIINVMKSNTSKNFEPLVEMEYNSVRTSNRVRELWEFYSNQE